MFSQLVIWEFSECPKKKTAVKVLMLTYNRRGIAAYLGRDVGKLKAKGGGKWKYVSEKDMLEVSEKFSPYR